MLKSMTAYARQEEKLSWGSISIELRSVNHRFLEMNIRMPDELRMMEIPVRTRIKEKLKRGKLDLSLQIQMQSDKQSPIAFNSDLAAQLAKSLHEIDKLIYNAAPVNAVDILNWPGVLDSSLTFDNSAEAIDQMQKDILEQLDSVLAALDSGREREGSALEKTITQRCIELHQVIEQVRENMPEILHYQRQRLEERLEALKAAMDTDRIEQEMVFIAQKADVDEELDRIDIHLNEIARILDSNDSESIAKGRRLDFVMQELNREANTLGSKSISSQTTQASVDMKVLIEQMREQIQNIE